MSNDEQSIVTLVFGKKGTGKTTLIKKMIARNKGRKNILIIDLINKFHDIADYEFISAREIARSLENVDKKILRLNSPDPEEIICAIVSAYYIGNVTIVMDECDEIFGKILNSFIREVVLRGRNQGIDLILSSLRPYKVNIDVRNQADIIYCFPVVSKEFLKSMVNEFGEPQLYDLIANLDGIHDYVKYTIADQRIEVYRKPKKKKPA